jgi:hypothetical protein
MRAFRRVFVLGFAIALAGVLFHFAIANAQQAGRNSGSDEPAVKVGAARPSQSGDSAHVAAAPDPLGAPVVVDGKTLFTIQERLFTFSPEQRAQAIEQRIEWLSKQPRDRIQKVHGEDQGKSR